MAGRDTIGGSTVDAVAKGPSLDANDRDGVTGGQVLTAALSARAWPTRRLPEGWHEIDASDPLVKHAPLHRSYDEAFRARPYRQRRPRHPTRRVRDLATEAIAKATSR